MSIALEFQDMNEYCFRISRYEWVLL